MKRKKKLFDKSTEILINPVEPINKPKEITNYFLVHLDKPVVVESRSPHKIFLTFPCVIRIQKARYPLRTVCFKILC